MLRSSINIPSLLPSLILVSGSCMVAALHHLPPPLLLLYPEHLVQRTCIQVLGHVRHVLIVLHRVEVKGGQVDGLKLQRS